MRNEENTGFKFPMRTIENEAIMILLYIPPGCIVTLFIFDDMIKNVQIAVSSLPQSTVRDPQIL